jgi:hypothetical protein
VAGFYLIAFGVPALLIYRAVRSWFAPPAPPAFRARHEQTRDRDSCGGSSGGDCDGSGDGGGDGCGGGCGGCGG